VTTSRSTMLLGMVAALASVGSAEPLAELQPRRPPQPTPHRPMLGRGCAYPAPKPKPREPTKAEVRAEEKRKRKAARRLELARKEKNE
jgi:hypothetical protein